jgi:hypothetical protein
MTKDEALNLALAALKETIDVPCYGGHPKQEAAAIAIKEALAQPAQKPDIYPEEARDMGLEALAYYTTPPKRPWVGLTDDERAECWSSSAKQSAINIEAKLKEKNT